MKKVSYPTQFSHINPTDELQNEAQSEYQHDEANEENNQPEEEEKEEESEFNAEIEVKINEDEIQAAYGSQDSVEEDELKASDLE